MKHFWGGSGRLCEHSHVIVGYSEDGVTGHSRLMLRCECKAVDRDAQQVCDRGGRDEIKRAEKAMWSGSGRIKREGLASALF